MEMDVKTFVTNGEFAVCPDYIPHPSAQAQADADLPPPTTPDMVLVPLFHAEFNGMSFVRVICSNEIWERICS